MTKSEDIHRMLLNMALAPMSTSIAAYKTAIKEITAYIDELEEKKAPKKPHKFQYAIMDGTCCVYVCDDCGYVLDEIKDDVCPNCGHAIDWSDYDDK